MKKVGVLWTNKKDDRKFLTGVVDLGLYGEARIGIFPNNHKKEDGHPDFNVLLLVDNQEANEK